MQSAFVVVLVDEDERTFRFELEVDLDAAVHQDAARVHRALAVRLSPESAQVGTATPETHRGDLAGLSQRVPPLSEG